MTCLNRSIQFAFAISLLLAAYVLAAAPATSGKEFVEQQVDIKTQGIKDRLQHAYDQENKDLLLAKKETVDSLLLPVLLLRELADAQPSNLCRLFRFRYQADTLIQDTAPESSPGLAWFRATAKLFQLHPDESIRYRIVAIRYPYVGTDYPLTLRIRGVVGADGDIFRTDWFEPMLANRDFSTSVYPERVMFHWTDTETEYYDSRGRSPAFIEHTAAVPDVIFNNPPTIYGLFDTIRLWRRYRNDPIETRTGEKWIPRNLSEVARLSSADGTLMRSIVVNAVGSEHPEIVIEQFPYSVRHVAPVGVLIQREVDGNVKPLEPFRPGTILQYMRGGRTIRLSFRQNSRPTRSPITMPDTLRIYQDAHLLFEARYESVEVIKRSEHDFQAYVPSESAPLRIIDQRLSDLYSLMKHPLDSHHAYVSAETMVSSLSLDERSDYERQCLKYNVFLATRCHDVQHLTQFLNSYEQLLRRDGLPRAFYIYSLEALTHNAFINMDVETGHFLAAGPLASAYDQSSDQELAAHIGRLLDQNRAGFALLAIQALRKQHLQAAVDAVFARIERDVLRIARSSSEELALREYANTLEQGRISRLIAESVARANHNSN